MSSAVEAALKRSKLAYLDTPRRCMLGWVKRQRTVPIPRRSALDSFKSEIERQTVAGLQDLVPPPLYANVTSMSQGARLTD
jgi:hypothetical protein